MTETHTIGNVHKYLHYKQDSLSTDAVTVYSHRQWVIPWPLWEQFVATEVYRDDECLVAVDEESEQVQPEDETDDEFLARVA